MQNEIGVCSVMRLRNKEHDMKIKYFSLTQISYSKLFNWLNFILVGGGGIQQWKLSCEFILVHIVSIEPQFTWRWNWTSQIFSKKWYSLQVTVTWYKARWYKKYCKFYLKHYYILWMFNGVQRKEFLTLCSVNSFKTVLL